MLSNQFKVSQAVNCAWQSFSDINTLAVAKRLKVKTDSSFYNVPELLCKLMLEEGSLIIQKCDWPLMLVLSSLCISKFVSSMLRVGVGANSAPSIKWTSKCFFIDAFT